MSLFHWIVVTALISIGITFFIMNLNGDIRVTRAQSLTAIQHFKLCTKIGFAGDVLVEQDKFISFLEQNGFHNPMERDGKPHFKVNDPDLDLLMNLGGDMLVGPANMDTAVWFMQSLDKVLDRLRPHEAPFHDGMSTIIKEPDANVS